MSARNNEDDVALAKMLSLEELCLHTVDGIYGFTALEMGRR